MVSRMEDVSLGSLRAIKKGYALEVGCRDVEILLVAIGEYCL